MRLEKELNEGDKDKPVAGLLLVAHPSQHDGYFKHTVILLMLHSVEEGALGLVLNRPLRKTLGEYNLNLSDSKIAKVPLYEGGPVRKDQIILVAWKLNREEGIQKFYFGIDENKARQIIETDPEFEIRGFLGYSGWGEGQLEEELESDSWLLSPVLPEWLGLEGLKAWQSILSAQGPEMQLLAGEPEDLSLN